MTLKTKSANLSPSRPTREATSKTKTKTETSSIKTLRKNLDNYCTRALAIYNSDTSNRSKLISEFPLNKVILDLELALDIKIIKGRLSVSQHPPLTEDIEGNYPRKWSLVIQASDLLCALYNLRAGQTDNAQDTYRTDFLKEFVNVMRDLKGKPHPDSEAENNGIRSRLHNFSGDTGIGRERFNKSIKDEQLLALSIWIAKENANNLHRMPEFHLSDMIERHTPEPIPKLVNAASVAAPAWVNLRTTTEEKKKQGVLF